MLYQTQINDVDRVTLKTKKSDENDHRRLISFIILPVSV
jgi:hypothetical protein